MGFGGGMKSTILYLAAVVILGCGFALGQAQYRILWNFAGGTADGDTPLGNLVFDSAGNLYGTTLSGGNGVNPPCGRGCGTVFKLSPNNDGTWTNTIIYSFCTHHSQSGCLDGAFPQSGLVLDAKGNLYGVTMNGGGQPCPFDSRGCGTLFKLSPPTAPGATWTERVLYNFCSNNVNSRCLDGAAPVGQLAVDLSKNFYGTTRREGNGHDGGTVFELSHGPNGWTETVLYNFCTLGQGIACPDGSQPMAGPTFDRLGNLYGTTELGGSQGHRGGGLLYKLSPGPKGWTETVLLAAVSPYGKGGAPLGQVIFDALGRIYSTFSGGGPDGQGGVFQFVPGVGVNLYWFNNDDGGTPTAGVLLDARTATLYGSTFAGGTASGGTVFQIVSPRNETVLYNFCTQPTCTDGAEPSGLIRDKQGNLNGTAKVGGANNLGVVFEVTQIG